MSGTPQHQAACFVRRAAAEVRAAAVLVHKARTMLVARATTGSDRVRLQGRACTVDQVRALCTALAVAVHGGPYPSPAGRPLRFAGRGLAVVNAVALVVVLGRLDGAPDAPVSAVLGVAVSGVQVGLAFDLGRRLRPFVGLHERVPASLAGEMGVLVAVSGLVAVACDHWARGVAAGNAGVACGLLLGGSAIAAPLMVVSEELYGPGAPARRLRCAERVLTRIDRRSRKLDRGGRRMLDAARRRLRYAEHLHVLATATAEADDPAAIAVGAQIDEVDARIRDLWREYTAAVPPVAPDDLDLAG